MLVVPFEYAEVLTFYDKLAPVRKENKWGFVDNTGTLAIPFKYDSLYGTCWGADWTGAKRDGKWTLISPDGVELMPPTYEQVECILDEDPARVRLNGKWGYINSLGEVVIPCIYDEARKFLNDKGLFEVKKDGKTLFLTKRGREVK